MVPYSVSRQIREDFEITPLNYRYVELPKIKEENMSMFGCKSIS